MGGEQAAKTALGKINTNENTVRISQILVILLSPFKIVTNLLCNVEETKMHV